MRERINQRKKIITLWHELGFLEKKACKQSIKIISAKGMTTG